MLFRSAVAEKEAIAAKDAADAAAKDAADAAAKDAADAAAKGAADAAAKGATAPMFVTAPIATSYFDLLKAVVTDPKMSGDEKKLLLLNLKGLSPTSDRLTYRTAIWILGIIALMTIGGIWHISLTQGAKVPEGLIAIASGAVGGLAGLLSPARSSDSQNH